MTAIRRSARLFAAVVLGCTALVVSTTAQTTGASASDQTGIVSFFSRWDQRALDAQRNQPNWLTPVVTSTARLKQEIRYDIFLQTNEDGTTTDNFGGSKGITTIPINRIEISINLPPYIVHGGSRLHDGFGDFSFMAKLRILAGNREHGDYALTAFLSTTFPTGSYRNGSPHPVITPTIAGGKGLGDFVYQATFGSDLSSADTVVLGRRMIFNNAVQYRGWGKFWPEMEVNSNFYSEGVNAGKKLVYLTPGVSVGRFLLYRNLQLTMAAGMELAVTRFHPSPHQAVFSVRLPF